MGLIHTKLIIPSRRPGWLPRPNLVSRLETAGPLVLVHAPAGYGKTTLLSEWARSRREASGQHAAGVGWIGLDEGDDDPSRLVAALIAAARAGEPGIEGPIAALVDALAARGRFLLVLDDAHYLRSRATLDLVVSLAERLPEGVTLAFGTRGGPDLPWSRWRARSALLELGPSDLRLSPEEAAGLVANHGGPVLGAEEAALLEARIEGWAAGVVLAARALAVRAQTAGRTGVAAYLRDVRAAHRWALDYLLEEVLGRRSPQDQDLLMRTSVLDRVSADMAQTVSDDPGTRDRFEALTREGLFLLPADERGVWYRYHSLFAELLLLRLRQKHPGLEDALRIRAAERLEADGDLPGAVEQRLAVGQAVEAARLVEGVAEEMLSGGEIETFLGWTDRLPPELLQARPALVVRRAFCLLLQGRPIAEIEGALRARISDEGAEAVRALIALLRGDRSGAGDWARRAHGLEGTAGAFARLVLAAVKRDDGQDEETRALLEDVARGPSPFGATMALAFLASIEARAGDMEGARRLTERALELAVDPHGRRLPAAARCLVLLGYLAFEKDDLSVAERLLKEGLVLSEATTRSATSGVYALLGRLLACRSEWDDAMHLMERARERARAFDLTDEDDKYVEMEAARIELMRGRMDAARAWAEGSLRTIRKEMSDRRNAKYEATVLARILIADQHPTQAIEVMDCLAALPIVAKRPMLRAEVELIRAQALSALGRPEARQAARAGLELCAAIGLVRLAREPPAALGPLLSGAAETAGEPTLSWYREVMTAPPAPAPLPGGLSRREREVLPYLRSDLTAREIGERLFVSEHTIKSHLKAIYAKLDVRGRAGAVSRAEELGLLPAARA